MYRGDISHILRRLAILLILFSFINLAKTNVSRSTAVRHTDTAASLFPQTPTHPLDRSLRLLSPPARLVKPGHAPHPSANLIRDELERGYILQAESSLRMLPNKMLAKERVRQYVAASGTNLGVQQEKLVGSRSRSCCSRKRSSSTQATLSPISI